MESFDCDDAQGYFLSHPLPVEEAEKLIDNPDPLERKFSNQR
ncbi:MAG: hypothetical protein QNJ68_09675 [Microcoleaceae cyanobacterium MO_207.B10]|nr:hypothetical protein [Microcoleaceae cyanobacterium MO_207.B10]